MHGAVITRVDNVDLAARVRLTDCCLKSSAGQRASTWVGIAPGTRNPATIVPCENEWCGQTQHDCKFAQMFRQFAIPFAVEIMMF